MLRAELDSCFFHLYGIERDDVDYIMDTFPIVKRKDEAAHGEYRTKRLILECYDAMTKAVETGEAYQTILDPPPAHNSLRHPESTRPPGRKDCHESQSERSRRATPAARRAIAYEYRYIVGSEWERGRRWLRRPRCSYDVDPSPA